MAEFVVHKHRTNRIHYDFRLEIGGVLKSWIVPRGPTVDPSAKRLAVETDEYPLSYIHFENMSSDKSGEIIIWDRGKYKIYPEDEYQDIQKQYREGSIHVKLEGKKLKGGYRFIKPDWPGWKTKWLLVKSADKYLSYDENILKTRPGSVVSLRRIK